MRILFCSSFSKDLSKIDSPQLLIQIRDLIDLLENSDSFKSIRGVQKLKGSKSAYRIRLGDYRIGLNKLKDGVELVRILHRRDIYKYFPE